MRETRRNDESASSVDAHRRLTVQLSTYSAHEIFVTSKMSASISQVVGVMMMNN